MSDRPAQIADIPGGPYDVEFFFDAGCPFAWQASVWIRRVQDLRGIKIGWRFISLRFINEGRDLPDSMVQSQLQGLAYHRICAAARSTDRKSTRLNSSHANISYAVFCLKKKNKRSHV